MKLTPNFSFADLIGSETARMRGINNRPPIKVVRQLRTLAAGLERVRKLLKREFKLSSGYRSPVLNRFVSGSSRSRHVRGLAADFTAPKFGSPFRVCAAILRSRLQFDQLIYEFGDTPDGGWVHIAFGHPNRRQVLTITKSGGRYRRGLRQCRKR
ncbi:MAG: hypothetical protein A3I00_01255 [Betaproteobacteria bacterium RIFCSPLOWO2_02_FULL_64_12]|nr:MAG: hypothetical protein A3I00_01255 [Betaproteobacteria bacterium RIFCSPLOWO2_02_FULL_64_12]